MFLLIHNDSGHGYEKYADLHSTMFLLIHGVERDLTLATWKFTFHNVSINSLVLVSEII